MYKLIIFAIAAMFPAWNSLADELYLKNLGTNEPNSGFMITSHKAAQYIDDTFSASYVHTAGDLTYFQCQVDVGCSSEDIIMEMEQEWWYRKQGGSWTKKIEMSSDDGWVKDQLRTPGHENNVMTFPVGFTDSSWVGTVTVRCKFRIRLAGSGWLQWGVLDKSYTVVEAGSG